MATRKDDFVTIASILKREIQKRKKQKKSKDKLINCGPISNASAEDKTELILFKKKKKKKRDRVMVQNDNNFKNDIATLKAKKLYSETCDDNNKQLIKDKTLYSNLSEDEFPRNIPIATTSEGYSLFKKKKKKKKRDQTMVQNDENMNNHIGTLKVDKLYAETFDENNKKLYLDTNFNKDELKRRISIANAPEDDLLFKKKKKKKKRDNNMVQNDENMNDHISTLKVDKFNTKTFDKNNKNLYLDETMDSKFNKDELKRRISIANAPEDDLLLKKKKKKKKRDKKMVQKDKYLKNDKATLKVEHIYNDTCDVKVKYLNKINNSASNLNKDNSTTSIQIANASEEYDELTLLKSPLKEFKLKKKKSKAKKEDTESSKYESIQKNLKNMEDLKICISEEQSNENHNDPAMIKTPYNSRISKVHEEEYPNLFQKLFKNKKKDNKKSIKAVPSKELVSPKKLNKRKRQTTDKEYSKNYSLQSVDMDVETYYDSHNSIDDDGEKKLELFESLDDRTMTYTADFTMVHTSYNSRTSKVRKEGYPELVLKFLKNKKREQKKVIKAVPRKVKMSPEKSNKRKQAATYKEYSKNDSPQPVAMDIERYDSNNYIGEDGGEKLEILDSRDDHLSEYRTLTDTDMYFGQYCNQTFNNVNGVHSHENVPPGNTPHQCDVCCKTFSYKSQLHRHEKTHTGEKPYACDVCGNSFSRQDHLVIHKRTHTWEKPYACKVCGKSFSKTGNLVVHNRIHTGERPYACNVCGKSFPQSSNLVTHNRTHTGEKPYACKVCGKSFSVRGNLVVHNRIHTGEKPYECGQCEKKFVSSSHCKRHTLHVHTKCL